MSTSELISTLEKLLKLHKSLYKLGVKKTDHIKVGDMDALNQILKEEKTHITAIEKLERERQQAARQLIPEKENPSLIDCIDKAAGLEKELLLVKADELTEIVFELKEQNYLNQQLIHQSLHYVNVSLNLLRPQPESINYAPPKATKQQQQTNGLFNSKA